MTPRPVDITATERSNTPDQPATQDSSTSTQQEPHDERQATDTTTNSNNDTPIASTPPITDASSSTADISKQINDFIKANCAPAIGIYQTAMLPNGDYRSSNRAAAGFAVIGLATYMRGDSTVAILSSSLAGYFVTSATIQFGFNESVKAVTAAGAQLVNGACRLGLALFNTVRRKTTDAHHAEIKPKQP